MDGIHDLGGKPGYGEVKAKPSEPVFKHRWEAKVFAMVNAAARAGAYQNTDQFRHAVERIDPEAYLKQGYYGRWLGGLETLLVEAGVLSTQEITAKAVSLGGRESDLIAARPQPKMPSVGGIPAAAVEASGPLFESGDRVRTDSQVPIGHTRLPQYARGKVGAIVERHDVWSYPDASAHGIQAPSQYLYTVAFESAELGFAENFSLYLDLFEPYLARAGSER